MLEILQGGEAIVWCAIVFLSITGFGAILLRVRKIRPTPGLSATAGLGLTVLLGGILNAAKRIDQTSLVLLIAAGLVFLFASFVRRSEPVKQRPLARKSVLEFIWLTLFCAVLVAQLAFFTHIRNYHANDDLNFYLAAPEKLLQTHYFGADPFSERRVIGGIGAGYFLQDLILTQRPLNNVQMADHGLGLLFCAALIFDIGQCFGVSDTQRSLLGILVLLATPLYSNLTFVVLPYACFLCLPVIAVHPALEGKPGLRGALLGFACASATAFKSTNLVPCAIFMLLLTVWMSWRRDYRHAMNVVAAGIGAGLLVLIPWCANNWVYDGTALFPLLGRGYHYSAYHQLGSDWPKNYKLMLWKVGLLLPPVMGLTILEGAAALGIEACECALIVTLLCLPTMIIIGFGTGGESVARYSYPVIASAFCLAVAVFCAKGRQMKHRAQNPLQKGWAMSLASFVTAAAILALSLFADYRQRTLFQTADAFHLPQSTYFEYAALNSAIPKFGKVLVCVTRPYLLDFRSDRIELADVPGAAGLPPGWPFGSGGAVHLRQYLLENDVRYLVFEYGDKAASRPGQADQKRPREVNTRDSSVSQWTEDEVFASTTAYAQFRVLSLTQARVFDDGEIFILDLACAKDSSACQSIRDRESVSPHPARQDENGKASGV